MLNERVMKAKTQTNELGLRDTVYYLLGVHFDEDHECLMNENDEEVPERLYIPIKDTQIVVNGDETACDAVLLDCDETISFRDKFSRESYPCDDVDEDSYLKIESILDDIKVAYDIATL